MPPQPRTRLPFNPDQVQLVDVNTSDAGNLALTWNDGRGGRRTTFVPQTAFREDRMTVLRNHLIERWSNQP